MSRGPGVQPFEIHIPVVELAEVSARLAATRGFDDLFGDDPRYGAPASFVRGIREHWLTGFDWRAFEARVNHIPQITAEIDGLTVHALHRRSTRSDAVPLILLHGWPGSFIDFLEVIEPLSDPPPDRPAFHVIVPSLPGHGFSAMRRGTTPRRVAAMLIELMKRLGYERYLVQGGNWGSPIGAEMALRSPGRVLGLHLNSINGAPPADRERLPLSAGEEAWLAKPPPTSLPHYLLFSRAPASFAYGLNDSPAGLIAFIGERLFDWSDHQRGVGLSLDFMVATVALYWFTRTIGSSALLYYEFDRDLPIAGYVAAPTAVALFPEEFVRIPRSWAERYFNIVQWNLFERGGKFPAAEVGEIFVEDVRRFAEPYN
jgi:epoxide hydrolase